MLKSSSRTAASCSQSPLVRVSPRKALRKLSTWIRAAVIPSGENSSGLRQWPVMRKSSAVSFPHSAITSWIVATLPTDFDIFSPVKRRRPLCIQIRAKGRPTACDCARSFS